jgi:hypothetical protein
MSSWAGEGVHGSVPTPSLFRPSAGVNSVGASHAVTAMATAGSSPTMGSTVLLKVSGSVTASGSCTTDVNGQCSFTYRQTRILVTIKSSDLRTKSIRSIYARNRLIFAL